MKRLVDIISPNEKSELAKSFDPANAVRPESVELLKNARKFVEKRVYVDDRAAERWAKEDALRRSRMISEVVWRVTCVIDGSETAVEGLTKFNLGYGFSLAMTKLDGHGAMVVQ